MQPQANNLSAPSKPTQPKEEPPRVSKSEMDSLYDELKQKSANNEKLPINKYVKEDSKKQTLETIFEDNDSDENIEEYSTDADDILEKSNN
jgi:antitoxin component of RelBE/YafQ-DinJ toxin-antitoxin module